MHHKKPTQGTSFNPPDRLSETISTMEKRNNIGLLLVGALAGGAIYFLFFTERGRQLLDRLKDMASEKLDEWLAELEKELEKAEKETAEDASVGHS